MYGGDLIHHEGGWSLIEDAVLLAIVAIGFLAVVEFFGGGIDVVFDGFRSAIAV